jgi:hypothetical protein
MYLTHEQSEDSFIAPLFILTLSMYARTLIAEKSNRESLVVTDYGYPSKIEDSFNNYVDKKRGKGASVKSPPLSTQGGRSLVNKK